MDNASRNKENTLDGYSTKGKHAIRYTTAETNHGQLGQRETTQMYQIEKSSATSTAVKPRGKHVLLDLESQEMTDFSPLPLQLNNSIQQPPSSFGNSKNDTQDGDTEDRSHIDERFDLSCLSKAVLTSLASSTSTFARRSSSLTHVQECQGTPASELYHDAHSSYANTLMQSSYVGEAVDSSTPVHRQNMDCEDNNHESNQISLGVNGDKYDEHIGEALVMNLYDGGIPMADRSSLGPERPTSRLSSASIRSTDNTAKRPLIQDTRVKKASVAASSPHLQKSGHASTPTPSRVPTEQDLLLLLMRRQRVRDHAHDQLRNELHQLQAEIQQLQQEGLDRDAELVDTKTRWHNALRESHIREADIRAFGEKYDKLKTWARDMHDAFASTRAEGSRLNDEVSKLRIENDDQTKERSELLEKIEGISEPMRKFKETIAELRATSIKLQTTQNLLDQAQKEVQEERATNKTHTLRIQKLESDQQLVNSRFLKQQDEMQNSLSLVSSLLQKNDNGFLHKIVAELTNIMQELQTDVATREESSAQFSSLLDMTEQNHARLSTAIDGISKAQAEHRTVEDIQEELDRLKAEHTAELATCSEQFQQAATGLEKARGEIEVERAASQEIRLKKADADKALVDCTEKCWKLNEDLSAERKRFEQLQDREKELQKETRDAADACQHLKEDIENMKTKVVFEKDEKNRVTTELTEREARITNLIQDAEIDKNKIIARGTKITVLQESCEKYEMARSQVQKDLDAANNKISDLEIAAVKRDSDLQALQTSFESAQESISEMPGLRKEVRMQQDNIKSLSRDVDEKQSQIDHLQEESSRINERSEKLAAVHQQCGKKDEDILALKIEINKLAKKMKPLSVLAAILSDEEKMALDEKVIQDIKAMIQRLHEKDHNVPDGDKNGFVRPRRAANRDNHVDDEAMVVQETQSQLPDFDRGIQDLSSDSELTDRDIGNSSPISSIRRFPDMAIGSRPVPELNNTTTSEDLRPATSNDEMLLRSSDTGIYPRTQVQGTILVPASSYEVSPMRTRQGSQIRHGTPRPQSSADGERIVNFSTPLTHPREMHPPNSAAKRRQTSEAPESAAKRRTVDMKNLEIHPSKSSVVPYSTQASDLDGADYLPVGGRKSTDAAGSKASSSRRSKKNPPSSIKSSKSARMEAQFNAPAF